MPSENRNEDGYQEQAHRRRSVQEWLTDIRISPPDSNTIWNGIVAVCAVIGVVFVGIQSCQMQQTLEVSQRAWVVTKEVKIVEGTFGPGLRPTVTLELDNSGPSPAMNLKAIAIFGVGSVIPNFEGLSGDALRGMTNTPVSSVGVLGSGTTFVMPLRHHEALTAAAIQDILTNKQALIVTGVIDYEDIFHRARQTSFCFRTKDGLAALVPCPGFNSAN